MDYFSPISCLSRDVWYTARMDNEYPMFLDLQHKLVTDADFCERTIQLMNSIEAADNIGDSLLSDKLLGQLIMACGFNPSLALQHFFPNFQDGQPMTLWSRPHAFAMMALVPNGSITIAASRQIGKCISGDTKVTVCIEEEEPKKTTCKELFSMARKKIACTHENK